MPFEVEHMFNKRTLDVYDCRINGRSVCQLRETIPYMFDFTGDVRRVYLFCWSEMSKADWLNAGGLESNVVENQYAEHDWETWYSTEDGDHAFNVALRLLAEVDHEDG